MKKKTLQILSALLLLSGLLLSACAPTANTQEPPVVAEETTMEEAPAPEPTTIPEPTNEPEPMTFTDDLGTTLEFTEYPQKIVSLSASTTEILFAIGAGEQVIGRDDMSLFPEEALNVPSVGALWDDLPAEAILALEPDLVVVAQIISEDKVQALRELGLKVYWQANPATYEDLWLNLHNLAALTGHEKESEDLITNLDARVKVIEEKIATVSEKPTVFYELDASDPSAPWTTGSGTFIDYIITTAGGINAAAALEGDYAQISVEELIAASPNVIFLADAPYGVTAESVAERPGWDVIAAVANEQLYPIDPGIMSIPGPRLVDGLETTAKTLHPELFE